MSDCCDPTIVQVDTESFVVAETPVAARTVVAEARQGPPGPDGPEGEVGPTGPTGPQGPRGEGNPFVFEQQVPATTWTIVHGLGHTPQVTVADTAGTDIGIFGATFPDANTAVLTFSPAAFSGTATLL